MWNLKFRLRKRLSKKKIEFHWFSRHLKLYLLKWSKTFFLEYLYWSFSMFYQSTGSLFWGGLKENINPINKIQTCLFAFSRQNLNSDFTDSALGSSEKSPLPYGNFQLRESTVQSILSHPRYGPKWVEFTYLYNPIV